MFWVTTFACELVDVLPDHVFNRVFQILRLQGLATLGNTPLAEVILMTRNDVST